MNLILRRAWMPRVCCCVLLFAVGAKFANSGARTSAPMAGRISAAGRVIDPQQGYLFAKANCASCHGLHGNAPSAQAPKLAGQNPAYLYQQLRAFRTGARPSPVMSAIAAGLSEREMAELARYFASQSLRPDAPEHTSRSAAGRRIFLTGIPGRVPACAACHRSAAGPGEPPTAGATMGGMMGGMMGARGMGGMGMMGGGRMAPMASGALAVLAGQHASYVVDQLDRFAEGKRPSPVMERIAAGMSEPDRAAVAAYLAPVSPGSK